MSGEPVVAGRSTAHRWRRAGLWLLVSVAVAHAGALALAACSSDEANDAPDGGGTTPNPSGTVRQDGTAPAPPLDAGVPPRRGNCAPVEGGCDIVAQDCPDGEECVYDPSGAFQTLCQPFQPSQRLAAGAACCLSDDRQNPCLPGLICIGGSCTAGQQGRCSPACCPGDREACGKSDPEGFVGVCDVSFTPLGAPRAAFNVCSYRPPCTPFDLARCPRPELVCIPDPNLGGTNCVLANPADKDRAVGTSCAGANSCVYGAACIDTTASDAGPLCRMMCWNRDGGALPGDASVPGTPFLGGCPAGETCSVPSAQGTGAWLGYCTVGGR